MALDAATPFLFLASSAFFLTAAGLRVGGAPFSDERTAGNMLRIPGAGILLTASLVHLASDLVADWGAADPAPPALTGTLALQNGDNEGTSGSPADLIEPAAQRPPQARAPRHALDFPAAYTSVISCASYTTGSIGVGSGKAIRAGSIMWLVGSAFGVLQSLMLLVVECQRAAVLRRLAQARFEGRSRSESNASAAEARASLKGCSPKRALRRWYHMARRVAMTLAPFPVAVSLLFLVASWLFVAGSLLYLVRPSAPFVLEAELCLMLGSCLFLAGTAATTGFFGLAAGLRGVLDRSRRGQAPPQPAEVARVADAYQRDFREDGAAMARIFPPVEATLVAIPVAGSMGAEVLRPASGTTVVAAGDPSGI